MDLNVENVLNAINNVSVGFIKFIMINEDSTALERSFDTFTNTELLDTFEKKCLAYYNIGSYWYIVVKN